jgi:hypothetical protein
LARNGPYVADAAHPRDPHNKYSHWHAALGVYDCDHWMGDATGPGIWKWPHTTPAGTPGQATNPARYAGLHSHDDGVIHMEPFVASETGAHATVGLYFDYGGWKVSDTGFTFLDTTVANGETCNGKPASLVWAVDGNVKHGNPADWRLHDLEDVVIAFVPTGTTIKSLGPPPSLTNLQLLVGDPNRGH